MNFLVLGSSGQIGQYLTNFLKQKGFSVTEWDIKISPEQDLRKKSEKFESVLKDADFIFFLAFDVGGAKYLKKHQASFEFMDNNSKIMNNVFELLKKHNKKFLFASSHMARLQSSTYGRLKLIGESYTKALGGIYSRFWNVYGLEVEEEKAHVITDFIKRSKFEREIQMMTDGKERRQFLYADDCCDALYTIYERYDDFLKEGKHGIDISNFEWNSILEIANMISESFGGVKITPSEKYDEVQKTDDELADPSGEILKYWKPKVSLKEGIKKIIKQMTEMGLLDEKMKSEKPLVSTITPCFKMKQYLPKFLEELPKQTYFEHLEIVLDHNEPDEEEIRWIEDFNKKYPGKIKHIIINRVDPIGTSMNRCIAEANGDLVTIWNVDDLRTPNSIESQVRAIINKEADIVAGDYKIVRRFGETEVGQTILHEKFSPEEYKRSMLLGPFVIFKKSICKKAGYFDEQLKSGADFDLSIRLAYNGKIALADDLLGYYLNEGKGASTRPDSKQPLERTVVELRYGIFDKIDMSYIPLTINYSIPYIISFGQAHSVKDFVKNYGDIINKNISKIKKSMFFSTIQDLTGYKKLKTILKNKLKKILYKNN